MRMCTFPLTTLILFSLVRPVSAQDPVGFPIEDFLGYTIFREVKVSPDGPYIAFITAADDFKKDRTDVAVWRIDLDEKGRKTGMLRLTRAEGDYSGLRWSPDGRYLAFLFTCESEENSQLYVQDVRGGEAMPVTDPERFKEGISAYDWLPDGSGLVFAAPEFPNEAKEKARKAFYGDALHFPPETPRTTFWRLAASDFQESSAESVGTVGQRVTECCASPDGRWIAYLSGAPAKPLIFEDSFAQTESFLLSTDGDKSPRQLTHNFVKEQEIQWARDGRALYANGIGKPEAERTEWTQGRLYRIDNVEGHLENLAPTFAGDLSFPWGTPRKTLEGRRRRLGRSCPGPSYLVSP